MGAIIVAVDFSAASARALAECARLFPWAPLRLVAVIDPAALARVAAMTGLDREELLRAVRPAALIAHESANIVKLGVGLDGDPGITVSANAEVGDHVGRVEAAVEGDGTTIAFNARFLADVLTNVDAAQFALELNGPLSPGVFKPVGDDRYVHVVMPLRTTS